jgi:hypothetical protein
MDGGSPGHQGKGSCSGRQGRNSGCKSVGGSGLGAVPGQHGDIGYGVAGVGPFQALGQFEQFSRKTAPDDAGKAVSDGLAQGKSGKIRNLNAALGGKFGVQTEAEAFATSARAEQQGIQTQGRGNGNPLTDGGCPGFVAIGANRSVCTQNGYAAFNAQARVQGSLRPFRPFGHTDQEMQRAGVSIVRRSFQSGKGNLLAGLRVDGWFTRNNRQAGQGDQTYARAAVKMDRPLAGRQKAGSKADRTVHDAGRSRERMLCGVNDDAYAVGGVRVVASVLDHGRPGAVAARFHVVCNNRDGQTKVGFRQKSRDFQKGRQGNGNRIKRLVAEQADNSGVGRGSGRGAGGESFPEG